MAAMALSRVMPMLARNSHVLLRPLASAVNVTPSGCNNFHTCSVVSRKFMPLPSEPQNWPSYNDIVYPPRADGEPPRPAEVCHYRANIKYSPKKLWYIASMIRGMSVDEAIKQLKFMERKGSVSIRETIEEAIDMAVNDYNVEFRSNLWIADSRVGKAQTIKGYRKHAGPRYGIIHYRYCHYMLRLREGQPPKHYYPPKPNGHEKLTNYVEAMRNRKIIRAL